MFTRHTTTVDFLFRLYTPRLFVKVTLSFFLLFSYKQQKAVKAGITLTLTAFSLYYEMYEKGSKKSLVSKRF